MAGTCVRLVVFGLVLGFSEAYYPLVYGKPGSCRYKIDDVAITLIQPKGQASPCADVGEEARKITIRDEEEFQCVVHLCLVKESERTAGSSVWGLSHHNSSENIPSNDKRVLLTSMERDLCESISGKYHVFGEEIIKCRIDLVRQPGGRKAEMKDIMFIASYGDCPPLSAAAQSVALFQMKRGDNDYMCQALQGKLSGNVCGMDLCFQDSQKCTPSDMYVTQETCHNSADEDSTDVSCTFVMTTGVSTKNTQFSTTGESTKVQVDASISGELLSIFSLSMTASVAHGFSWSETSEVASTFSETTQHTLKMDVRPGYRKSLKQLVGVCGPYRIQTHDYTFEEVEIDTPTC